MLRGGRSDEEVEAQIAMDKTGKFAVRTVKMMQRKTHGGDPHYSQALLPRLGIYKLFFDDCKLDDGVWIHGELILKTWRETGRLLNGSRLSTKVKNK